MYHLAANDYYWYGDFERAMSASESSFTIAGVELAQPGVQAPRRRHAGNHSGEYGALRGGHRSRGTRDRIGS